MNDTEVFSSCTTFFHSLQVMHGGLFSEDKVTLEDINKVDRDRQPPESGE